MEHIFRNSVSMAVAASKDKVLAIKYLPDPVGGSYSDSSDQLLSRVNKNWEKAERKHERLRPKFSEILMRKMRMFRVGGVKKVFKHLFNTIEGEWLLKASHCYISTTSGPISGLLFISDVRVAFCSETSIKVSSRNGEQLAFNYKVMIPINKINRINESENVMNPSEKYLEIVTKDNFEFWFMGFLNYKRTFNYRQQATAVRS